MGFDALRHGAYGSGAAVIQLRINCTALPSASSGWTLIGVFAGIVKKADPSLSR